MLKNTPKFQKLTPIQNADIGIYREALDYIFENEWQSFRTKRSPCIEFTSAPHTYPASGRYKIMVKVVDILGIDTSKIIEVVIP